MRQTTYALLLALVLVSTIGSASTDAVDDTGSDAIHPPTPIDGWVSASSAIEDGVLRLERFDEAARSAVERQYFRRNVSAPTETEGSHSGGESSRCDFVIVTSSGVPTADPAREMREASVAFVGRVVAMEPGFFRGDLKTLTAIEVSRWLTPPQGAEPPGVVYWIQSDAELTFDGTTYCRRGPLRERPNRGHELLVATRNVLQREPLLLLPYAQQVFFETEAGTAFVTGRQRAEEQPWPEFLEAMVEEG